MGRKLIFTSHGLSTSVGRKLIGKEISRGTDLSSKKIFLFCEPYYSIEPIVVDACVKMGFEKENIFLSSQCEIDMILTADYIYLTEGNTFQILSILRERGIDKVIKEAYKNGAIFIGASAGAMIAGVSIEEAFSFDRNYVRLSDYNGLALFDGIVIPHYTKAEMKEYIKNSPGIENRYKMLFSVANDKILVLEMED